MEFISKSLEDTFLLASHIAKQCNGGEIILLNGDLGAGKTTFTKGFAKALGITNAVTSPTFTLMKTYYGRLRLYHFDMYRIIDEGEVEELGFEGTLKHQYRWQIFDQIIISNSLYEDSKSLHYVKKSATIFHSDFLFVDDETYGGKKLFRTYIGPKYQGGFSDHLPVYIDIRSVF